MHGSSGIVLNCYRKESTMTRFNTWSQTSTAYTKPNPAKRGYSVDTRLIVKAVIEDSDGTKLQVDALASTQAITRFEPPGANFSPPCSNSFLRPLPVYALQNQRRLTDSVLYCSHFRRARP